jgi:hypothetical protein
LASAVSGVGTGTTQTESKKNWRELYEAGILEFDSAELLERISEAEQAIDEELVVLMPSVSDDMERQKLEDAKQMLEDEAARCERLSSLGCVWINTRAKRQRPY